MTAKPQRVNDLSWMIGGPQGSGVDSSATAFARACAHAGLDVFGKREYYSNIKGEHSYFTVRAASRTIRSHIDDVHVLATFDAETAFRHVREVVDDGAIVYDPSLGKTKVSDIPTIERRLKGDLQTYLISRGAGETLDDLLTTAKQRGVTLVPIPYNDLLDQVADEFKVDALSKIARMINMLAVGASMGLVGLEFDPMVQALNDVFRGRKATVDMNASGARKGYDLAKALAPDFSYRLERMARKEPRLFPTGGQAGALGQVHGAPRGAGVSPRIADPPRHADHRKGRRADGQRREHLFQEHSVGLAEGGSEEKGGREDPARRDRRDRGQDRSAVQPAHVAQHRRADMRRGPIQHRVSLRRRSVLPASGGSRPGVADLAQQAFLILGTQQGLVA